MTSGVASGHEHAVGVSERFVVREAPVLYLFG